jgi:hypothetical protein
MNRTDPITIQPAFIQRLARLVPGLMAEIVPKANHITQVTALELVNEKILKLLANKS